MKFIFILLFSVCFQVQANAFEHATSSVNNHDIQSLLNEVFNKQVHIYTLLGNLNTGNRISEIKSMVYEELLAQQELKGNVVDSVTGKPLVGVTIKIKGSTAGTATDSDGNFRLSVQSNTVLIISNVGYNTKEVAVNGRSEINILLTASVKELNPLVVIGYGTQKKSDLTGSIAAVDMNAISDIPVSSIDQKMIGQVAGVQIQQPTGAPGGGTSVKIRGSGSIGAGNDPLYVIDGMPYSSGMNQNFNPLVFINPNDIESISILKDASATAIYGSRGSNGVIIITTKKAVRGRTEVNYSSMVGVQQVPQKGRPDMMNQREFADFQKEVIAVRIKAQENREATIDDYPVEYRYPDQLKGDGTDWYGLLLRTAPVQDHHISIRKGTKDSRINFSLGYFKQDGVVRNTGLKRFNSNLGMETKIGSYITIGASLQPSYIVQNRTNTNTGRNDIVANATWANPVMSPYDSSGKLLPYIASPQNKYNSAWGFANPLFVLRETQQTEKDFQNLGSAYIELKIVPALTVKSSLSTIWQTVKYAQYIPSTIGGNNKPPTPGAGRSFNNESGSFNWLLQNTLNYNKSFKDHRFNLLLGYTSQKSTSNGIDLIAFPYSNDLIHTINAADAISDWSQNIGEWSMISYIGRLNYSYENRYFVTATLRSDGSSRFGANKRYASFPSVAVAWRVSNEKFLKGSPFIDNLKLRLSYGKTGNYNIGNYASIASINAGAYVFGSNQVAAPSVGLSNPNLTWEQSNEVDAGIDVSLFDDRLSLVVDWYHRKTENMLMHEQIPAISGFTSQLVNSGRVRNNGIEFSLGATPVKSDFRWDVNMNLAFNRNKVLALDASSNEILSGNHWGYPSNVTVVGKPIAQFFGLVVKGLLTEEDMNDPNVPKGVMAHEGAYKYRDVNGDGQITAVSDYTAIGNPYPDFTFGLSNNFSYKDFSLSIQLHGQQGGHVYNSLHSTIGNLQGSFNMTRDWVNRWRSPEDPGDGLHESVAPGGFDAGWQIANIFIQKATYLRIDNVTISYNLPQKIVKSTGFVKRCRIYSTVQNLAMFTTYNGANPEGQAVDKSNTLVPGYDSSPYPLARTISLGINLAF